MSTPATRDDRARRAALAAALGGLLFLVYLLTFSGLPVSDDERFIIDTVDSIAVRGSLLLNQTSYLRPVQATTVEPGQPLLSAPLYWLAYHTPWVGNVHALYLFAPLVTALTGVLVFLCALDLGYGERTAVAGALLFGLTTIVWPYTKTYFREPLTTLNLFAAAFFLAHWRRAFRAGDPGHWRPLVAGVALAALALLSKEAMLIALPALLLIAYPGPAPDARRRRQIALIALGVAVVAVLLAMSLSLLRTELLAWTSRYTLLRRVTMFLDGLPQAWRGVGGYLISPGKGIWWTSPVLVLALGAPLALPRSRWRESWLPLGLTLAFALVYAAVRGPQWSGGTGWGARYMVPLVPFLLVAALPLVDRALNGPRLWPRLALGALALWGFAVQIGGTYVALPSYYAHLEASITDTPWRGPAVWTFRWSQPIGSLLYLPQAETDIRWLVPAPDWATISVIAGAILLVGGAILWLRGREDAPRSVLPGVTLGAPLLAVLVAVFALWQAYDDPRYHGADPAVHEMRSYLEANAAPADIILLSSPTYVPHFMNYYKGAATWYSLPWAPGERYSPEHVPQIAEGDVETLAGEQAAYANTLFSQGGSFYNGRPIWLVMDLGPDLPWAPRPVERYFSLHNYPVAAVDFNPYARLVQYLPYHAPGEAAPAREVGATFGGAMRLAGYDVTASGQGRAWADVGPGDQLGLSLVWEAAAPVGADYTVAVHVIGPDGLPVVQQDRAPAGGFAPTSTWQPGERLRDNYGFILPEGLPPGGYQVWVVVYSWPSLERLPVTGPGGEPLGDHVVLGQFEVR